MHILIDYSWLSYRNKYAYSELTTQVGSITYSVGHVYGVFKTLIMLTKNYPEAKIYLVIDGFPSKVLVVPTYKANRDKAKDTDISQNFHISEDLYSEFFLLFPKVHRVYHKEMEADDTIAVLAETLPGTKVIFSTDGDLRQIISKEKHIYCSTNVKTSKFELEDEDYVLQHQGIPPKAIPMYKALVGDPGDNYFGIPYFPRELAKTIAKEAYTIEALEFLLNDKVWKKSRHITALNKIVANMDLIRSNYFLAKIDPEHMPTITSETKATVEEFLDFCNKYNLISIKNDVYTIINK